MISNRFLLISMAQAMLTVDLTWRKHGIECTLRGSPCSPVCSRFIYKLWLHQHAGRCINFAKSEVIPMGKTCQIEASLSCVQSKLRYPFFLAIAVVMLTAISCISCFGTQLSSVDIAAIWKDYSMARNVDKVETAFRSTLCQSGQMLKLLTLCTPIYGKNRNTGHAMVRIRKNHEVLTSADFNFFCFHPISSFWSKTGLESRKIKLFILQPSYTRPAGDETHAPAWRRGGQGWWSVMGFVGDGRSAQA
jgi:hypothetical protein